MEKKGKILILGFLLVVIFVALFIGCENFIQPNIEKKTERAGATPYADLETLSQIAQIDNNVDWRVARFFALKSLQDFRHSKGWDGAVLSEYPLIIHSTVTGDPRYYEFRVIYRDSEIGAIVCVVEQQEGDAIQYVLPFASAIASENARSLQGNKSKLIDAGYPGTLLIRENGNGRSINAGTGIEDMGEYPVDIKLKEFLEKLDPAEYEEYGITSQEMYDRYIAQQTAEQERIDTFWRKVNEVQNEILNLSEEEILEAFRNDDEAARSVTKLAETQWILWDWYSKSGWYNPGGWCGPNVVTLITLGLGTKAGYTGVPTSNNSNQIQTMYNTYEKKTGTGAVVFSTLDSALQSYTNYKISFNILNGDDAFHRWNGIHNHVRSNGLPVVSLRSSILFNKMPFHYRLVIGTCIQEYREKHKILFATWYDYYNVNWYYMWDNGTDGKVWWEKAGQYYHFESARVMRK